MKIYLYFPFKRSVILLLLLLLTACELIGPDDEPEQEDPPPYLDEYPWAQAGYDAFYTYEDEEYPGVEGSLRIRIVEEDSDLELRYVNDIPEHGDIPAEQGGPRTELIRGEEGLEFPRYSPSCPFSPNWLFLPYEIEKGKSWKHMLCDAVNNRLEIIETEVEVEVPAGTFDTFVVRESWGVAFGIYEPGTAPGTVIDTYYNRDVGPVKLERRDTPDGPVIDKFLMVRWTSDNTTK